jgi:hypothetical protein
MCKNINDEFENFFLHCQKVTNSNQREMEVILRPLKFYLMKQQFVRYLRVVLIFAAICCGVYYVDTLNWYFCAIGRVAMIKILPIWDWRSLESAKCLVSRGQVQKSSSGSYSGISEKDCRTCEHFGMNLIWIFETLVDPTKIPR